MSSKTTNDSFWWGVGHAAFQVEGNPADSDWKTWTQTPDKITDGTNANLVTGFWNNYEKDFDQAADLGCTMFRLSIAWERVEPSPGVWDKAALDHYEKIILALRRRNIEPLVTLHHFVLPAWLSKKGGLESSEFADHFTHYAMTVVERLALGPAQVKWWMTFNEPMVLVTGGYILGEWPPGKKSLLCARKASRSIAKAHNQAVSTLKKNVEFSVNLKIGLAYHWREMQAENFGVLKSPAEKIMDWIFNTSFLNRINKNSIDYLGINYYGKSVMHFQTQWPFFKIDEGAGPTSDLGWVIYPEGLGEVLNDAYTKYKLPLLVSENGLADAKDLHRAEFIKNHIDQIKKALNKNIPVIGYLHWSLTDNFEWARGLSPRFGLIEVDYETGERKPRASFEAFKNIIKTGI